MNENNADVKLALEEMRLNMQETFNNGSVIDQKTNLILAIGGVLAIPLLIPQLSLSGTHSTLFLVVRVAAFALFLSGVGLTVVLARPQDYRRAIASEWVELNKRLFNEPEREAILTLLASYVTHIEHNHTVNENKAQLLVYSFWVMAASILLFALLPVIP